MARAATRGRGAWAIGVSLQAALLLAAGAASASPRGGGEGSLVVPRLDDAAVATFGGVSGRALLWVGLVVCLFGIALASAMFRRTERAPVHPAMREVGELIYQTCKTYLASQLRFLVFLEVLTGLVIVGYFGVAQRLFAQGQAGKVATVVASSLVGLAGSCLVAWFGIRVNTFANARTAFAALRGEPLPTYLLPLEAGMSIGLLLVSVELGLMLGIVLFLPGELAGPCFIGFAIGESLGACALRIAGGIFTKIADIGSDLMKIVFKIGEDDARNPGVIADCVGDNAGDAVGPSADGFETYGVTGVALIAFILLAVSDPSVAVQLLVWLFVVRSAMVVASALSYVLHVGFVRARYARADRMDFERALTSLLVSTSGVSIALTFVVSRLLLPHLGDGSLWWQLSAIVSCGTIVGALLPQAVKAFTSTGSAHVREIVAASRQGGPSLNVLSGLTAGNFSAYWLGLLLLALMGASYQFAQLGLGAVMTLHGFDASPIFAFGLVAFGFLGIGPVILAVDSYGPVTDNAQSVYELSLIERVPGLEDELRATYGFQPRVAQAKRLLEQNDAAGNTFKATAKPVLIGTAVVGATTMVFSIVIALTDGFSRDLGKLSLLHPPFFLGLIAGGALVHWFAGASLQAVSTGAYRAVEFIRTNLRLEGVERASVEDSKRVVQICTTYAQKGMFNIFLVVFFSTLAFAFYDSFLFIGYLASIALFGLFQALFMANAGGAWDNAKKIVEVELREKGTDLHAATIVGDTVGDPFKDTASVALNPVIKFTTLLGLLAVETAEQMKATGNGLPRLLAGVFFVVSTLFVWRSFHGMRIGTEGSTSSPPLRPRPEGTATAAVWPR